ncbi:MAG: Gfo/Idh/MocA family oxidoreductase, partial [Anaerolineales bacterium]|nr:Gfo/Idh/MocA family oxidoreductase [Anaerolineales bacterium]
MTQPLAIGLLGCGNISDEYMQNLPAFANWVQVTACADQTAARAQALAQRHQITALSPEALLADPTLDIILNLTPPAAHFATTLAALQAGKHVYCE